MSSPTSLNELDKPLDLKDLGISEYGHSLIVILQGFHVGLLDLMKLVLNLLLDID